MKSTTTMKRKTAPKKLKLTASLKKQGVTSGDIIRVNKTGRTIVIDVVPQKKSGSTTVTDRKRQALKPGKRLTASGSVYTERRKNRSDRKKSI